MIGTILSGVAALGSAIYGAVKSSKANNKARQLIQDQRSSNKAWYDTRMGQDYTMRSDVQAAINRQRELLDEQYNRARATNAVAGGTDASLALQREAANRATAQTMSDVAASASAYKDNIEQQYRAQDAALNQQQAQSYQQQAAQTAAAASQVVNAGLTGVAQGLAAKGLKSPTPTPSPTPIGKPLPGSQQSTDLSPNGIPSPAGQILGPDELPKVRKQTV